MTTPQDCEEALKLDASYTLSYTLNHRPHTLNAKLSNPHPSPPGCSLLLLYYGVQRRNGSVPPPPQDCVDALKLDVSFTHEPSTLNPGHSTLNPANPNPQTLTPKP